MQQSPSENNMQQPPSANNPQQPYYPPGQYQQPMPVMPVKAQKKPRRWPWIVALIVVFFMGYGIGSHSNDTTASTTTQASSATVVPQQKTTSTTNLAPTAAPAKPTTPPKPKVWTTTQTFTGNGNKKTDTFSVTGDSWKLQWSCDPTQNALGEYNIIVDVDNSDGSPLDLGAINTLCKAGNISGETIERQPGAVYLDVQSEDAWTIKIQEMR
jgi:hypothetical protein